MELMQEILFTMRSPTFLAENIPSWVDDNMSPVLRLCLDMRSTYSSEELDGMFGEEHATAVEQATHQGWLFPSRAASGRLMYLIPDELRTAIRNYVVEQFRAKVERNDEGPLTFQDEAFAMSRDIDVMLEYVGHHDVKLTADGSLYKRNLTQLLELLEVNEQPLEGGWRFGYGRRFHDYPDRLALLYDFAYYNHFIEETQDGELCLRDESRKWMETPQGERQRQLVRYYLSSYRRPIKRLVQVVQLIAYVSQQWVKSASVLDAMGDLVTDYFYDSREQVWQLRIVKMLTHLGVLRFGEDENAGGWFQITNLGQQLITPESVTQVSDEPREAARILIVQPNFEIVVTADQPMVTAELAVFTELKQSGVVRVYRLTEDTVLRAIANGRAVAPWLDFVSRHAQTPIPGNVERTLYLWEKSYHDQADEHKLYDNSQK